MVCKLICAIIKLKYFNILLTWQSLKVIGSQVICCSVNTVAVSAFLRCVHLVPGSTSFLGLVQIEAEKGLLHIVGCRICFFKKIPY